MKYGCENFTFKNDDGEMITVKDIPSAEIDALRRNLNLSSRKEALEVYCCDHGYMVNAEQEALNAKAAGVKYDVGAARKPRKSPTRKPDEVKRTIIKNLEAYVASLAETDNVKVTNIERVISFTIGADKYELTLSKKRKPKTE